MQLKVLKSKSASSLRMVLGKKPKVLGPATCRETDRDFQAVDLAPALAIVIILEVNPLARSSPSVSPCLFNLALNKFNLFFCQADLWLLGNRWGQQHLCRQLSGTTHVQYLSGSDDFTNVYACPN